MLTKRVTYKNFDDVEVTETLYFNLTQSELMEMQYGTTGGLKEMIERIVDSKDNKMIMETFKTIIMKAYGEKSPDGKYLRKEGGELAKKFMDSAAYDAFLMELFTSEKSMADFINGILPKDIKQPEDHKVAVINQQNQ